MKSASPPPDVYKRQVLDTNLKSAFLCCKEAARRMVRQRYGRICLLYTSRCV